MGNISPRFLPVCVLAKFWNSLILPQILVVFKSLTTKIDLVDFLQMQATFWKTNYTTFSYLVRPIYGQHMSENDFWLWPRNFDFARFFQTFALKWLGSLRLKNQKCKLRWWQTKDNSHINKWENKTNRGKALPTKLSRKTLTS